MSDQSNTEGEERAAEALGDRALTIRWKGAQWERIEATARRLGEREHMEITVTDVVRSGALRFADEVLGPVAAETA